MGDCFQVHVFDGPEVEMLLESGGCMAITILKNMVFEWFHFFYLFTDFVSRGMVLGHILMTLGSLGDTFSDFGRSWEQAWILMVFQGFPGRPQAESIHQVEGKVLVQGPGTGNQEGRLPTLLLNIKPSYWLYKLWYCKIQDWSDWKDVKL